MGREIETMRVLWVSVLFIGLASCLGDVQEASLDDTVTPIAEPPEMSVDSRIHNAKLAVAEATQALRLETQNHGSSTQSAPNFLPALQARANAQHDVKVLEQAKKEQEQAKRNNQWQFIAEERKRQMKLVRRGLMRMVLRQLARAFALWRYTAEKLNEEKRLLGGAAARWMDQQLSAAWNTWRNAINERKRQETLLRRSLMWLIDRHKARAFAKWVEFVQQREDARRQARRALSLWQKQNVARAFRQWLACTTRKQAQEESDEAVDSDLVARLRAEIAELKRMLALCSQTCDHISGCPVCKSSELDAKQMMMKRALEGMFNLQMARAWRKWRDWRMKLLLQAQAARKVLSRWQNQLTCKAYNKLKEHARVMRAMMDVIRKWHRRMLTMAWNTWLEYSAAYSDQAKTVKRVLGKMLMGPFSRAFDMWRDAAERLRRIDRLLKRCALRWGRSKLFEYFYHMVELSEAKRLEDLEFGLHLTKE